MSGAWSDLRAAVREVARDRRFTLAAVLALGLGIGTAASVFALVDVMMIRDVPFPEPHRLMSVRFLDARGAETGLSYLDYRDWRNDTTTFEGIGADISGFMSLGDDQQAPERLRAAWVSADTFRLLRTVPVLGRDFLPADDQPGAPLVTILGYDVWQRRYGGDPSVIGRSVRVDDVPATVVGVMPAGVSYPFVAQMWQPLAQSPGLTASRRDARRLGAVGRLRADVSPAQARAELTTIATRLADAYPGTNARTSAIVYPLKDLSGDIPAPILAALVGAVSIVLLVCWSNLASLLLARGVTRARDLAIRSALGASRSRILRQLLFESACLAGAGAVLGFGLALAGIRQLVIAIGVIEPGSGPILPYWVDVSPSVWVWGFVFGLAVASSVAFGLLPAWHLSRVNPQTVLASVGRTSTSRDTRRWTSALLVGQLALAMVLLFVAGLLWRGFLQAANADPVMQTARLVAMRMNLPAAKYADPLKRRQFLEQLDERLSAHPAVDAAAMGSHIPIEFGGPVREIEIDGVPRARDDARPLVMFIQAGDGYTETIGVPIVRGRNLEPGDDQPGREAVVIDQALATRDFQGADPIGRRIRLHVVTASGPRPPSLKGDDPDPAPWFTIVGVTRTVPQSGPRPLVRPVAYARFRADPYPDPRIVLLARGDVAAVSAVLREEVRQLDASLPLYAIEPVVETLARQRFPTRLVGTWFTTFAGVALVMAVVGLFALTAHGVAQRRHEIGVRMAVGARGDQVVWLFLRRTVTQLAVALALGCAGALGVGGLLSIYLGETNPRDPLTLMIVIALLSGVAILSAAVPARRAARVDPAVVLRAE